MRRLTTVMIDWSTPVVKLRLRTAPDSVWKNEFARISHMTDGLETEPRLDGMTRETNTAAARARKEQDEIAYARMQAVKAQEESAKRMTERFRSPG